MGGGKIAVCVIRLLYLAMVRVFGWLDLLGRLWLAALSRLVPRPLGARCSR